MAIVARPEDAAPCSTDEALEEAVACFICSGETGDSLRERLAEHTTARQAGGAPVAPVAPGSGRNRPLVIDAMDLLDSVPEVYGVLNDWHRLSELLHSAGQLAALKLGGGPVGGPWHVRLKHVPGVEFARTSVSQLRVSDVGRFVRITGTVTRAGAVKVVQEWREFMCEGCRQSFKLRASPANGYDFDVPSQCASGEKKTSWDGKAKRPKTTKCSSKAFSPLPPGEHCMAEFQEVRVQDQMQAVGAGAVPRSIAVVLFGDLASQIQPGDSVLVEGVVWQRWRPPWVGKRLELEVFIEASNVERLTSESPVHAAKVDVGNLGREQFADFWAQNRGDEWRARASIVRATAPWLSGLPVPKLALLLALIGGVPGKGLNEQGQAQGGPGQSRWERFQQTAEKAPGEQLAAPAGPGEKKEERSASGEAQHVRTTPHLLLLGDPGTGKSQLLQAAQELSGRSVRTSGLGCTNAGLTCAAVRDGPDFVLEAGALVLADGGVCCVDEFSTIRSHDRAAVHEAMEQQTVSVAKAGLVCRLRSECSVIAAQNCRGAASRGRGASYDRGASVAVNSGLPPPLLSRFDLVVVFAGGGRGAATEEEKADCILEPAARSAAAGAARSPEKVADKAGSALGWDHGMLREFIAWARENALPEAPAREAQEVLEAYFTRLRRNAAEGGGAGGGITVRTFQSLWRLAQAHARLMCHSCVRLEDAIAVIVLHRAALQDHIVGADAAGPGDAGEFQPTLPDCDGETAWCSVAQNPVGVDLHHGTELPNLPTYKLYEAHMLRYLGLGPQGPVPIMDAPQASSPPGPAVPLADGGRADAEPPRSQSWASPDGGAGASPPPASQASVSSTQPRRRLGCRMR